MSFVHVYHKRTGACLSRWRRVVLVLPSRTHHPSIQSKILGFERWIRSRTVRNVLRNVNLRESRTDRSSFLSSRVFQEERKLARPTILRRRLRVHFETRGFFRSWRSFSQTPKLGTIFGCPGSMMSRWIVLAFLSTFGVRNGNDRGSFFFLVSGSIPRGDENPFVRVRDSETQRVHPCCS